VSTGAPLRNPTVTSPPQGVADRPVVTDDREVARTDGFARVRADLQAGRTDAAIRRLRSMLAANPSDMRARAALAEVYRRIGNPVEAGRWAFLGDTLTPQELAAFNRAHPSPWLRLRLLRYPDPPESLANPRARERLEGLVDAAERYGPPPRYRGPTGSRMPPRYTRTIPCLFVVMVIVVTGVLALIGLLRLVDWFVHL
jgi:hypothetical protein